MSRQEQVGPEQAGRPLLGIAIMVVCTCLFASIDTIGKFLVTGYPVGEILFIRYLVFVCILVLWIRPQRLWSCLCSVKRPWLQGLRGGISVLDQILFVTGLQFLALADSHVLVTAAPLVVTALSVLILKERVGVRRWLAVAVGFVGVIIVLQPQGDLFRPAALFPLTVVFLFACYQILTRIVNVTDRAEATLLYTGLTGLLVYGFMAPFGWVTPSGSDWILLILLGALAMAAHALLIQAIRFAPVATLQPFFYLTLVWAIFLGWLFFDHLPGGLTLTGAALIVACGLYTLHRERRLADLDREGDG